MRALVVVVLAIGCGHAAPSSRGEQPVTDLREIAGTWVTQNARDGYQLSIRDRDVDVDLQRDAGVCSIRAQAPPGHAGPAFELAVSIDGCDPSHEADRIGLRIVSFDGNALVIELTLGPQKRRDELSRLVQ